MKSQVMDVLLILERFDESLVVMAAKLCWGYADGLPESAGAPPAA